MDIFPAEAFKELCSHMLPYLSEGAGPVPYQSSNVSETESGSPLCLEEGVSPDTLEQILARPDQLLCHDSEAQVALATAGLS